MTALTGQPIDRKGPPRRWPPRRLLGLSPRLLLFALLWLVIAGEDPGAWIIGLPAVFLATYYSMRLARRPSSPVSIPAVLRFIPYFLWQSLRGSLDVALRVMRPVMRIAPGFQRYRIHLLDPHARVFFLDSISLLPGTLSADMRDGFIEIHALDAGIDLTPELADLERRIARLFGESLDRPSEANRDV